MSILLNFRKPDPFVEIDGVRKPMTDYPNLVVTRDRLPVPMLREVNTATGLLIRGIAQGNMTVDKEEPFGNFRITGAAELDYCQTGWDPRFTYDALGQYRRATAKTVASPKPAPKVPRPPKPEPVIAVSPPPAPVQEDDAVDAFSLGG